METSKSKRVKGNTDWDLFEEWFPDEYRMYMYFAKSLELLTPVLNAFTGMWLDKLTFYTRLEEYIEQSGCSVDYAGRQYDDWISRFIGQVHTVQMRLTRDKQDLYVSVYRNHKSMIYQRKRTVYQWNTQATIEKETVEVVPLHVFMQTLINDISP